MNTVEVVVFDPDHPEAKLICRRHMETWRHGTIVDLDHEDDQKHQEDTPGGNNRCQNQKSCFLEGIFEEVTENGNKTFQEELK